MTGAELQNELARRENNRDKVLRFLRERGSVGALNTELVQVGGMRAVGGRVDELRAAGFDIETRREGRGLFRFVLHEPKRLQPGTPGYLASLPVVASIYDTARPDADDHTERRLF